jgi:hypothetical protein
VIAFIVFFACLVDGDIEHIWGRWDKNIAPILEHFGFFLLFGFLLITPVGGFIVFYICLVNSAVDAVW